MLTLLSLFLYEGPTNVLVVSIDPKFAYYYS